MNLLLVLLGIIIVLVIGHSYQSRIKSSYNGGGMPSLIDVTVSQEVADKWEKLDHCRYNHLLDGGVTPGIRPSYLAAAQALMRKGVINTVTDISAETLMTKIITHFPRNEHDCDLDQQCGWCPGQKLETGGYLQGQCLADTSENKTNCSSEWWTKWNDSCRFTVDGVKDRDPTREEVRQALLVRGEEVDVQNARELESRAGSLLARDQQNCGSSCETPSNSKCGWCITTKKETSTCQVELKTGDRVTLLTDKDNVWNYVRRNPNGSYRLKNNDGDRVDVDSDEIGLDGLSEWVEGKTSTGTGWLRSVSTSDNTVEERCDLWQEYQSRKKFSTGTNSNVNNLSVVEEKKILEHPHLAKYIDAGDDTTQKNKVWTDHFKGRAATQNFLNQSQKLHYLLREHRMIESDNHIEAEIARLEDAVLNSYQKAHLGRLRVIASQLPDTVDNSEKLLEKHKIVIDDYNSSPEKKRLYLSRRVSPSMLDRYNRWQNDRIIIFRNSIQKQQLLASKKKEMEEAKQELNRLRDKGEGPNIEITQQALDVFLQGLPSDGSNAASAADNYRSIVDGVDLKIAKELETGQCVDKSNRDSCSGWWCGKKCLRGCEGRDALVEHKKGLLDSVKKNGGKDDDTITICDAYRNLEDNRGMPDCRYRDLISGEGMSFRENRKTTDNSDGYSQNNRICKMSDTLLDAQDRPISCQQACREMDFQALECPASENQGAKCYCRDSKE